MVLSAFEILAILEIIIFTPLLGASIYVTYKHGLRKQLGWRFLVLVSLFRLIGGCTSLASVHHPSSGLTATYDIMNSFGLSAVVYCALGLLGRVQRGMDGYGLPPRIFRLLGLPGIAGLVLCIVASINIFSDNPSDQAHGIEYFKAAMCLFLAVFVADVAITFHCFTRRSHIQTSDSPLLKAVAIALPFMAVRTTFSMLCAFAANPSLFSTWSTNWKAIVVHGTMGVLMEIITVLLFLWAGFSTPQAPRPAAPTGKVSPAVYAPNDDPSNNYAPNVYAAEIGQAK